MPLLDTGQGGLVEKADAVNGSVAAFLARGETIAQGALP